MYKPCFRSAQPIVASDMPMNPYGVHPTYSWIGNQQISAAMCCGQYHSRLECEAKWVGVWYILSCILRKAGQHTSSASASAPASATTTTAPASASTTSCRHLCFLDTLEMLNAGQVTESQLPIRKPSALVAATVPAYRSHHCQNQCSCTMQLKCRSLLLQPGPGLTLECWAA